MAGAPRCDIYSFHYDYYFISVLSGRSGGRGVSPGPDRAAVLVPWGVNVSLLLDLFFYLGSLVAFSPACTPLPRPPRPPAPLDLRRARMIYGLRWGEMLTHGGWPSGPPDPAGAPVFPKSHLLPPQTRVLKDLNVGFFLGGVTHPPHTPSPARPRHPKTPKRPPRPGDRVYVVERQRL